MFDKVQDARTDYVVNVASVPCRSPFRYPGGKTWLIPRVRAWLKREVRPGTFVEPFAGGASVGLAVAFESLAQSVVLVELDAAVAAVWQTILSDDAEWLAREIRSFEMTISHVRQILDRPAADTRSRAFQTIVRNRVARGGILAPGAGIVKNGEAGRGIASRWYPNTLAKRILAISELRGLVRFEHGDGLGVLRDLDPEDATVFVDPPYTATGAGAGHRLYAKNDVDHEALFARVASFRDFLMTYDENDLVLGLARRFGLDIEVVPMKSGHHAVKYEMLLGRDLSWARVPQSETGHEVAQERLHF